MISAFYGTPVKDQIMNFCKDSPIALILSSFGEPQFFAGFLKNLIFAMRSRAAVARRAHNPKVRSSILLFATVSALLIAGLFFILSRSVQLGKRYLFFIFNRGFAFLIPGFRSCTMYRILFHLSILFFLISSCGKKEGSIYDCTLSPEFLEGGYRKINVSMNGLEVLYNDQIFPLCKRDDILVILSSDTENSGNYNLVEGSLSCSPPTYEEGRWVLQGDTLLFNQVPFKVVDFSCIGFRAEGRVPDPINPGQEIVVITTYSKVY